MMVRPLSALRRFTAGLQDLARRVLKGEVVPATPETFPWEHSYPEGINWRTEIPPRPVFSILDDAVGGIAARFDIGRDVERSEPQRVKGAQGEMAPVGDFGAGAGLGFCLRLRLVF